MSGEIGEVIETPVGRFVRAAHSTEIQRRFVLVCPGCGDLLGMPVEVWHGWRRAHCEECGWGETHDYASAVKGAGRSR